MAQATEYDVACAEVENIFDGVLTVEELSDEALTETIRFYMGVSLAHAIESARAEETAMSAGIVLAKRREMVAA